MLRNSKSLYAYIGGNPISLIDPLGLADSIDDKIAAYIAQGNLEGLQTLIDAGALNPAQQQLAEAGLQRLESTAAQITSQELKGSVNRVFPGQLREKTLAEIIKGAKAGDKACQTARKLPYGRFSK